MNLKRKKKITTRNTQIEMHINDGSRAAEMVSVKSLSSGPSIHDRVGGVITACNSSSKGFDALF